MFVLILKILLTVLIGYLVGCFSFSTMVAKKAGVDIRKVGSGNAGTTNVLRSLGVKYAVLTLGGDLLKGTLAAILGKFIIGWDLQWSIYIGGIAAVIGHNFPFNMKFKGGKGIATTLGVMLSLNPLIAGIFLVAGIIANLVIKVYSITSIVGMFVLALVFSLTIPNGYAPGIVAVWFLFALVLFTHRENIIRILKGKERGIDLFK